jgi:hypothetical protein
MTSLASIRNLTQKHRESITLSLIFCAYLFYFKGTFIGATDLLTGDIEHWYGASAHFLNGFYNGVIALWNPYSQGGEPYFPYFGLFRMLDPVHLILVGFGRLFDAPIFNLYHFQYVVRCFICLLGFYYVFKELNQSFSINILCFLFILLYFSASVVDAMYATFCWIPYILFFFLRFIFRSYDRGIYYCLFFLGVYIGAGNYHIATGLFFLLLFGLGLLFNHRRILIDRFKSVILKNPIGFGIGVLLMLLMASPVVSTFFEMTSNTVPIARTFYDRNLFLNQSSTGMGYQTLMSQGQSLTPSDIWTLVTTATTLRFFGFSVPLSWLVIFIAVVGVVRGNDRLKINFIFIFVILIFYLMGLHTPVHEVLTLAFPPLSIIRITRFADIFFIFVMFYFFSLGVHELTKLKVLGTIQVGTLLIRGLLVGLVAALLVGQVSYFETWTKYHPDFDHRAGPVTFSGKRTFALPRTHYYLMDPVLYRTVTALQMLAAPPRGISSEAHPYFRDWDELNRLNRAGAVYGLRSIFWTKGYHRVYLLGEKNLSVFKDLLGVDEDIISFREQGIVATDDAVESVIGELDPSQLSGILKRYLIIDPDYSLGIPSEALIVPKDDWTELPVLATASPISYRVKAYDYNELRLEVVAPEDGFIVYRDGFLDDWQAEVDGTAVTVRRVDVYSKGVFVRKGTHEVIFSYFPKLFVISMWTYLACSFILFPTFLVVVRTR